MTTAAKVGGYYAKNKTGEKLSIPNSKITWINSLIFKYTK